MFSSDFLQYERKYKVDEYSIPKWLCSAPYTIVPNCHPKPIIQEKIPLNEIITTFKR